MNRRMARLILGAAMASSFMLFAGFSVSASADAKSAVEQNRMSTKYSLSISKENPEKGETVEVAVLAEGMTDVYAFEIILAFDATKLKWLDAKTDVKGFSVKPIIKDGQATLAHTLTGQVAGLTGSRELYKIRFESLKSSDAEVRLLQIREIDSKLASITEMPGSVEDSTATPAALTPFKDLAGYEWAEEAIAKLASEGIVKGTTENTFSPGKLIKRADFLLLLMRTLALEAPETPLEQRFADVEPEAYYADSVSMAAAHGIVIGDEQGLFRPAAPISREDMMVLTERALRAADQLSEEADVSVLQKYKDRDEIADYAGTSIAALTQVELVQGYSDHIQPKLNANRAQAAMMIYNVFSYD